MSKQFYSLMFAMSIFFLISFVMAWLLGKVLIPFLHQLKVNQTEREELKSHQKKNGTPTMGGLIFIIATVVPSIAIARLYPATIPIVILSLGFGIIGFIDDFLKVVMRRSDGLYAWQKMLLQVIVTAIFAVYIIYFSDISLNLIVPFSGGYMLDLKWGAIVVMFLAVVGTVNGVNFTDGLDGLATSVTMVLMLFFLVASIILDVVIYPIILMLIGALAGFLIYNKYPAKVFMGDTGSLFLGGFVVGIAYVLQLPLFLLIVGFVYAFEVISVILQVFYFRRTGGKRLFKMAPIHHHYELIGWSEREIVFMFSIAELGLCAIGFLALVFGNDFILTQKFF